MTKVINRQQYLTPPSEEILRPLRLLTAGGVAGAVSRTLTAPFDRLKMILQNDKDTCPNPLKKGIKKMLGERTWKALFRGNGTNVLKIAPETAIKLAATDSLKRYVVQNPEDIHPMERIICGGVAGATAQLTIFPLEVIRTRLAALTPGTYRGILNAASRIYHNEGVLAFYKGLTPNMVGIFPYAGVEIACFEILLNKLNDRFDSNPPDALIITAGTCSATLAQFISYPFSVVRTRLQSQGVDNAPLQYKGMIDCFSKTYRLEGYRGLYKGLVPSFVKLAPAAGISWLVFEKTKKLLELNGK